MHKPHLIKITLLQNKRKHRPELCWDTCCGYVGCKAVIVLHCVALHDEWLYSNMFGGIMHFLSFVYERQ